MAEDDFVRRVEELQAIVAIFSEDAVEVSPDGSKCCISFGERAVLEIFLPCDYPSKSAPTPVLNAPTLGLETERVRAELLDMYDAGTEVIFQWAEHVRDAIETHNSQTLDSELIIPTVVESVKDLPLDRMTFTPSTNRYGQRVRHFDAAAMSETNRVEIHHGELFHPPKSGPSENFQAHVAVVSTMGQVQWVLRTLLEDKRIARATHNMIAYRLWDAERGAQVADNDDDGESTAGQKLAALLDLMSVNNVIVVVSRWFGGTLLGPARFKHIANTARSLLEDLGLGRERSGASSRLITKR